MSSDTITYVAAAAVLLATAYVWVGTTALFRLVREDVGPRMRRRLVGRGFRAMGVWEIVLGAFLIWESAQGDLGGAASAPALILLGVAFLALSRYPRLLVR